MATNKNAKLRYQAIDKCLRNRYKRYYIEDLVGACNKALMEYSGKNEPVKVRQVYNDLNFMEEKWGTIERLWDGNRKYFQWEDTDFSISQKESTELGTRIVEVHNGSSLFTGNAGGGESNLRRYILENDLLEAIVAMPEKSFYHTGIGTFIWILTNRKEARRKGKVQLIDATKISQALRKNLGEKNCEVDEPQRKEILRLLQEVDNPNNSEVSKVFDNKEFGYWEVPVMRPKKDENGNILYKKAKKGQEPEIDYAKSRNESERIPLNYPAGIEAFYKNEVEPYDSEAIFGEPIVGYEISFTKYFYKPMKLRSLEEIRTDIRQIEKKTEGMLDLILG